MDVSECVSLLQTERLDSVWSKFAELMQTYFRVEVEGLENIPREGPAVIAPNHSGYSGADGIIISHMIHSRLKRLPRMLAHRAFFSWFSLVRLISLSFGLRKASVEAGLHVLQKGQLTIIFPEGESGNFKSSIKKYKLQKFHSGFLRMAIMTRAPIVPCIVIGAEESYLNLGNISLERFSRGLMLPMPMNLVPLPAKWKIRFLKPILMDKVDPKKIDDWDYIHKTCNKIQRAMQKAIQKELKARPFIFFPSV